jgi:hypothetical protein
MLRQRRHPAHIGSFNSDRVKRVDMTGERFGDFTMFKAGWRGSWWGRCKSEHEKLFSGGQLRADRKAGKPGPKCEDCKNAAKAVAHAN